MEKKYVLLKPTTVINGAQCHRIQAVRDFADIRKGTIGGYVETEENLSHEGNCWIYDNAAACGKSRVHGDAIIYDEAIIADNALVSGSAKVHDEALVKENASVLGQAELQGMSTVGGSAIVCGRCLICDESVVSGDTVLADCLLVQGSAALSEGVYSHGVITENGKKEEWKGPFVDDDHINKAVFGAIDAPDKEK